MATPSGWNKTRALLTAGEKLDMVVNSIDWDSSTRALAIVAIVGAACSIFFQRSQTSLGSRIRYVVGFILSVDFIAFWLVPIVVQGAAFKLGLIRIAQPIFNAFDESKYLRSFAEKYVYRNPRHSDFFATQMLFLVNFGCHLALALYWQVNFGYLPWWLIAVYNFGWVGIGGRGMGAAYAMAHKEGHNTMLYKPAICNLFGNVFENWVGLWYGGLPYNFSSTHISIHHRLDGGLGDTLYVWDLQRCSWTDFTVYVTRGLVHMSGFGPLRQFLLSKRKVDRRHLKKLCRGLVWYWVAFPAVLLWLIPSLSFYFWIVLQPLVCMSYFITLLNGGFHAFIDEERVPCVESTTLVGSLDDYFGEDDHMSHHNAPEVYYKDLPEYQESQHGVWAKHNASVFQGADAFTFGLVLLLKAWPILADRYVDYSGKLSKAEIEKMLERRAKRLEIPHDSLLPPLQDKDATNVPQKPRRTFFELEDPNEGSAFYRAFMRKSHSLQLALAHEMVKELPPIKKLV